MPDGSKYSGEWFEGKANGKGVKVIPNGATYDGIWTNGKFEKGKCTYADGKIYDGEWKDGKPHG